MDAHTNKPGSKKKPVVFLSGPISSNALACVREIMPLFHELLAVGAVPVGLQFGVLGEMISPLTYEEWMDYAFGLIDHSDALIRLDGVSAGADREVDYAFASGVKVFLPGPNSHQKLTTWVKEYHVTN